jgi:multicomponent Na+:H+ antiporter subunit G
MEAVAMARDVVVALLMTGGTFLMLVTGIGLIRLPDVYCRMHAAGKAGTLGIALLILASALHFVALEPFVSVRALLAILFQGLTTPGATHLLAHACYVRGYPLHDGTQMDELKEVMPAWADDLFGEE